DTPARYRSAVSSFSSSAQRPSARCSRFSGACYVSAEPRVVIVGAGPTGLGAAWRLNKFGNRNWDLYESSDHPGGLASSVVDAEGFTWDIGGHVLFSHYRYFDDLMVTAL